MRVVKITKDKATVELSFDEVEHLGIELSNRDSYDWWQAVWEPMLQLRSDAENEAADEAELLRIESELT